MATVSVEVKACDKCGRRSDKAVVPRKEAAEWLYRVLVAYLLRRDHPVDGALRVPELCRVCERTLTRLAQKMLQLTEAQGGQEETA